MASPPSKRPNELAAGMEQASIRVETAIRADSIELDLSDLGIAALPDNISRLTRLQRIYLDSNELTILPVWFNDLKDLSEVRLGNNKFADFPEPLRRLKKLKKLYLNRNCLAELPDWLGELKWLHTLSINHNHLTSLADSINGLETLHVLYCGGNRLATLPESVSRLAHLQELNVHSNLLVKLPKGLDKLTKLEVLDADYNRLKDLPGRLNGLGSLRTLYLRGNLFLTLPQSIRHLNLLEALFLQSNHISILPDWLGDLGNLQSLDLENNRLRVLPDSLGNLANLKTLDLGGNQLSDLPTFLGEMDSLEHLYLQNNQLRTLPESLRANVNRISLNLDNNPLSSRTLEAFSSRHLCPAKPIPAQVERRPRVQVIRILHLSDLHFTEQTSVTSDLVSLLLDLKSAKDKGGLGLDAISYLVISGDFTDRSSPKGWDKAFEFVSKLMQEFGLPAERCIFVPGNHDVTYLRESYEWRDNADGVREDELVRQGKIFLVRVQETYPLRLKGFAEFYNRFFPDRPYPLDPGMQGMAISFQDTGVQFLALNSCWQIDRFHPARSGLFPEAVATAIKEATKQLQNAAQTGGMPTGNSSLLIAVWHHAVTGLGQMEDTDFLANLRKAGVRIVLHGDVHEMQREVIGYFHKNQLHVVGSGTFGGTRPESTPRLYNVLEINPNLKSARVYTRERRKQNGEWRAWREWDNPEGGDSGVGYYDISLK